MIRTEYDQLRDKNSQHFESWRWGFMKQKGRDPDRLDAIIEGQRMAHGQVADLEQKLDAALTRMRKLEQHLRQRSTEKK